MQKYIKKETCKICNGKGFLEKKFQTLIEIANKPHLQQCPNCNGYGFILIKSPKKEP